MNVHQEIADFVQSHDVALFMKGTPNFPQCGFSATVIKVLDHLGVTYSAMNVLERQDIREGVKTFSDWPTIPQLYVKGEFIGGSDIVVQMFQQGELKPFLAERGVSIEEA
jgi:monothiol glutaredoxin